MKPKSSKSPWVDFELEKAARNRDKSYKKFKISNSVEDHLDLINYNKQLEALKNEKMIKFFSDKESRDFLNNKKYWDFYKTSFILKSDKGNGISPNFISNGPISASDPPSICRLFNEHFTTISSTSDIDTDLGIKFIDSTFEKLRTMEKFPSLVGKNFTFIKTCPSVIVKLIENLDQSTSPGISDISVKVFKKLSLSLAPLIAEIINECISTGKIPSEWKCAVVTALFKNKGALENVNNYRGISVLAIISKLFENILATQILEYFSINKIIYPSQYGFREGHSCEAALHELLSEINSARNKRLITLLLFIDFRKAFDLVSPILLLHKLKLYGFDSFAIALIKNYFTDRSQCVKFDGAVSDFLNILLGIAQGSILGPLLFLIFINDLAYLLDEDNCKMFADDTTTCYTNISLSSLFSNFNLSVVKIQEWCCHNRLDINWDKTKIMFIHIKKKITLPATYKFENFSIEVVSNFKLLGITIDNNMNFLDHVRSLRHAVNKKLYSINTLFFLPKSVKVQFFKTFIMPHFDYCLSLLIYFSKKAIQSLSNCYYLCLFKLFNFSCKVISVDNFNTINNNLEGLGLNGLIHRLIIKLSSFFHKILHEKNAPIILKHKITFNHSFNKPYPLRNVNKLFVPGSNKNNQYGDISFSIFFSKFINETCVNDIKLESLLFNTRIKNNINIIFLKFIKIFPKFDIIYIDNFINYQS
jgi:hypothetical protein